MIPIVGLSFSRGLWRSTGQLRESRLVAEYCAVQGIVACGLVAGCDCFNCYLLAKVPHRHYCFLCYVFFRSTNTKWHLAMCCSLGLWPLMHHALGGHCPGNIAVGPGYNYCECIDILFCGCCSPVVFIFDALLQVVLGTTKLCLRSRLNRGFKKSVRLFPWL